MSKSATSVFIFGIYLVLLGIGFLLIPNTILGLFGLGATNEPWIRVVAMLLLILSYYYIEAARHEYKVLFRFTVHCRISVLVFFIAFVLLNVAPAILILFGVIDLIAAIWTAFAMKSESEPVFKF
jgi:hypothetical protein